MEGYTKNEKRRGIAANATPEALIKRINIFIEEKDWESAYLYLEQVTDIEPDNPDIYLLKILVENKVSTDEELIKSYSSKGKRISDDTNYKYIKKFGNESIIQRVEKIDDKIIKDIAKREENKRESDYKKAIEIEENSKEIKNLRLAQKMLTNLEGYKESKEHIQRIEKKIQLRKEEKKKKRKVIIIFCSIVIVVVGIISIVFATIKNRKEKQEYFLEVEKFKEALIKEGYTQRDEQTFYIGFGYDYKIGDEGVVTYSGDNGVTYYYYEGDCNYYSINPYTGEICQISNNYPIEDLTKLEKIEVKPSQRKSREQSKYIFYQEYDPINQIVRGHFSGTWWGYIEYVYYNNGLILGTREVGGEQKRYSEESFSCLDAVKKFKAETIDGIIKKYNIKLSHIYLYSRDNWKEVVKEYEKQ